LFWNCFEPQKETKKAKKKKSNPFLLSRKKNEFFFKLAWARQGMSEGRKLHKFAMEQI
jgi:hypothetical protein